MSHVHSKVSNEQIMARMRRVKNRHLQLAQSDELIDDEHSTSKDTADPGLLFSSIYHKNCSKIFLGMMHE
jgi:hypothetical protein